jgi:hypothetical protein
MSKIVRPIRVRKMPLEDVPVGSLFRLGNVRYIKLSDYDDAINNMATVGVLATTLIPLCVFDSVCRGKDGNKSIEERAVTLFISATKDNENKSIITYGMPDADDYRQYGHVMRPHIKDAWYIDNGVEDLLKEGEYFYVDEFGDLCKGNDFDEREDGVSRRIGIRAFYSVDPDTIVTVQC